MKTIEQIALEIAQEMSWAEDDAYIEFSKRLIEAWQAQQSQEPVAWACFAENGNIRIWKSAPPDDVVLVKENGIELIPLFLAPPPAIPGWLPIESAPKDGTPILGLCVHDADEYWIEEDKRMTVYGAHSEGLSHVEDGPHVLEWGGSWDDRTWEDTSGGSLPDWWFRYGSEFEEAANPTHWMKLPEPPKQGEQS